MFAGAVIALYGSIGAFLALTFEYVNRFLPDPALSYSYPAYDGGVRFAMASLIVLAPVAALLFTLIRRDIEAEPARAHIGVRRFAIVCTLFLASAMLIIDLITLITTFLGGELTLRFGLKTLIVFLVGALVFMHFIADSKGYWIAFPKRARVIGIAVAVLALVTVVSGFFIIGSPRDARTARIDDRRVSDLQSIQWQVVHFWQQKRALPAALEELNDPISSFMVPADPETGVPYGYERTSDSSFRLCAEFGGSRGAVRTVSEMDSWQHDAGRTCFDRTIDPELYPVSPKPAF